MNKHEYVDFLASNKAKWQNAAPCFIINERKLRETIASIQKLLPGEIVYSHKTNPHPAITKVVKASGLGFLLSSVEESTDLVKNEKVDPKELIFQSPSLTDKQYQDLKALGISRFIIDSNEQLEMMLSSLDGMVRVPEILVRINTGIAVMDSELPYSTDSYLGFSVTEAPEVFKRLDALRKQGKIILGLHNHLLSQNTFLDIWEGNLAAMAKFVEKLKADGISLDIVDFGGGYPIYYGSQDVTLESISKLIVSTTNRMKKSYPTLRFIFEPGRKVVGESITLVAKVVHVKHFLGKNVIILNCSLYNSSMDTLIVGLHLPVDKVSTEKEETAEYIIRGSTPDSLDVFNKKVTLPYIKTGDYLAFFHAGAYSFWSDFISLKKPEHVLI